MSTHALTGTADARCQVTFLFTRVNDRLKVMITTMLCSITGGLNSISGHCGIFHRIGLLDLRRIGYVWMLGNFVMPVYAGHLAREEPVEPIFTERSFIEKNLEFDVDVENGSDAVDLELALGATWVFWERLQLGLDIPYGITFPDQAATVSNISDLGLSAKILLCCDTKRGYTFVSVRGDVALPSGSRAKGIGGEGGFGFSLLGGHGFTVIPSLPDLTVQIELAYAQQMRLSSEQLLLADDLNLNHTREKEFNWNIAFGQQFLQGRVSPVFEVLGTSIVDALDAGDEGTIVELAVGSWFAPFPDDSIFSAVTIGAGWRWPVTDRRSNEGQGLVIFEWTFE